MAMKRWRSTQPLALIADEGDHEEEEVNDDKDKAKEGVKGLDEELVVQRQSQELGSGLNQWRVRGDIWRLH